MFLALFAGLLYQCSNESLVCELYCQRSIRYCRIHDKERAAHRYRVNIRNPKSIVQGSGCCAIQSKIEEVDKHFVSIRGRTLVKMIASGFIEPSYSCSGRRSRAVGSQHTCTPVCGTHCFRWTAHLLDLLGRVLTSLQLKAAASEPCVQRRTSLSRTSTKLGICMI